MASRSFSFAACIFDMDDLLVDTSRVWIAAEERLLARIGRQRTAEVAVRWNGMNATDIARVIHELYRPPWPLAEFQGLLRQELSTAYRSGPEMPALRGAVELVRALSGRFPLAVASGSPPEGIAIALARLNIREHFAVLISSEEVPAGKPAPDVFLAAAARLKVEPARCVVFEDSLAGARAARAAGMACFTVPSAEHDKVAALSTRVLRSLDEAIPLLKPQA
ncbi:MAG: HAD family phosphatase [Planctomycetota bacterium]